MVFLRGFIYVLGCFAVVATLLPFFTIDYWLFKVFSFPRLQIAVVCLIAMILSLIFLKPRKLFNAVLLFLLFATFVYQASLLFPYTSLYPIQALRAESGVGKDNFSIMEANVLMTNKKTGLFVANVKKHDPDLLLLLEPNHWWAEQLSELDQQFPYSIKYPLENTYGMILLSKLPLRDTEINFIIEDDIPSFYAKVVLPTGKKFDLYCIHPKPPTPSTSKYPMDTELLIVGKRAEDSNRPTIVMGDFNDVPWSYTVDLFQEYTGLLDPRQGRGMYNTFNAHIPLLRYPIDHFFYSKQFGLLEFEQLENAGSDHFALYIKLHLEPQKKHSNSDDDLDDLEEKKEAKKEVDKVIEDGLEEVN